MEDFHLWLGDQERRKAEQAKILAEVGRVTDLDQGDWQLLDEIPSKLASLGDPDCHIHDILIYRHQEEEYFAKGEEVYFCLERAESFRYDGFQSFAESIFESGDSTLALKSFAFPEDPEIEEASFSRFDTLKRLKEFEGKGDPTPQEISDPSLRKLYYLYRSYKENLIEMEGRSFAKIFGHHGLDVISEVMAWAVGTALGVKVPKNSFAYRSIILTSGEGESFRRMRKQSRYLLSKSLPGGMECLNLDDALSELEGTQAGWGMEWHNANPLSAKILIGQGNEGSAERMALILERFPQAEDLAASDFLDHFLGGSWDRKLKEFLLPQGKEGPIYTIDYGEALFAELRYGDEDPHYLKERHKRERDFLDYLDHLSQVGRSGNAMRRIAQCLTRLMTLKPPFWQSLLEAVPRDFWAYELQPDHCGLEPNAERQTLLDYFLRMRELAMNYFGAKEDDSPERLHDKIRHYLFG